MAILIPIALFPVSAFAVDPVSAATMANAFAQAVTSYGASQGVSMMFDVSSADGIGEAMHDLWNNCKGDLDTEGITYIPDYEAVSTQVWSTLYKKIGSKLGISLSDTVVGYLDAFYNWLLSGAENIVEVDNQYYEWTLNQSGTVDPVTVISSFPFPALPVTAGNKSAIIAGGFSPYSLGTLNYFYSCSSSDTFCAFVIGQYTNLYTFSYSSGVTVRWTNVNLSAYQYGSLSGYDSSSGVYYHNSGSLASTVNPSPNTPQFPTFIAMIDAIRSASVSSIDVQPYIGDAVPRDVHIPDNTDVNYSPLPFEQALDHDWDNTTYGDGTGAMTDAQSEAAEAAVSQTMVDARTITNYYTTNPPSSPSEVVLPFLPIQLPSFDFSLSGIWHYVVTWVQSLGTWLTTMFTVWNSLPYAMVVPVYATAVIVIVLGVYKRFFM